MIRKIARISNRKVIMPLLELEARSQWDDKDSKSFKGLSIKGHVQVFNPYNLID